MKKVFNLNIIFICTLALVITSCARRAVMDVSIMHDADTAIINVTESRRDKAGNIYDEYSGGGDIAYNKTGFILDFEGITTGMRVGRASITFCTDNTVPHGAPYSVSVDVRTSGALNRIFNDQITIRSSGIIYNDDMIVNEFSNISVRTGRNARTRQRTHTLEDDEWTFFRHNRVRVVDAELYSDATDPLTLIFYAGKMISQYGNCNFIRNAFMDETGFIVESRDRGPRSNPRLRFDGQVMQKHRCDIVLRNRAGREQREFPFNHEFARRGREVPESSISIYYAMVADDMFVPVHMTVRNAPVVGSAEVRLTRIRWF